MHLTNDVQIRNCLPDQEEVPRGSAALGGFRLCSGAAERDLLCLSVPLPIWTHVMGLDARVCKQPPTAGHPRPQRNGDQASLLLQQAVSAATAVLKVPKAHGTSGGLLDLLVSGWKSRIGCSFLELLDSLWVFFSFPPALLEAKHLLSGCLGLGLPRAALRVSWVLVAPAAEDPVRKLMAHRVRVPAPFCCTSLEAVCLNTIFANKMLCGFSLQEKSLKP